MFGRKQSKLDVCKGFLSDAVKMAGDVAGAVVSMTYREEMSKMYSKRISDICNMTSYTGTMKLEMIEREMNNWKRSVKSK